MLEVFKYSLFFIFDAYASMLFAIITFYTTLHARHGIP